MPIQKNKKQESKFYKCLRFLLFAKVNDIVIFRGLLSSLL